MNLTTFRADPGYWDRKLAFYLHDPPDKALAIPGHEARAKDLRAVLHLSDPEEGLWQRADIVAAGMDRAWLPGYEPEAEKSGAVDFRRAPKLTHPVSEAPPLEIFGSLPEAREIFPILKGKCQEAMAPLEEAFAGQPNRLAPARFHLVHHALRELLARDPAAKLGGLWYRLPADTRIPDHSIWQHSALVSALATCYAESQERPASLLVFSLTPVQDFLIRARKLRDFWTGSLFLSWLAFEGLRQVIYYLGSDHVLYPSLIGQPLVNRLLSHECAIPADWLKPQPEDVRGVASLPNKFVCLVPGGREKEVAEYIAAGIEDAWKRLGQETLRMVKAVTGKSDAYLDGQFTRQFAHFWELRWAAGPFLEDKDKGNMPVLLPAGVWQAPEHFREEARRLTLGASGLSHGEEGYYGPSHALVQSFLAAGKSRREAPPSREQGIKCDLHGDLEILRYHWNGGDKNPRPARDPFWAPKGDSEETRFSFKAKWAAKSDFKDSERLSAVGLAKRVAYRVTQKDPGHPLRPFFAEADRFPSTTEVALSDWLDRVEANLNPSKAWGTGWRRNLANYLHDQEPEVSPGEREAADLPEEERRHCREILKNMERLKDLPRPEDRHFALLAMDGDRMGRLVSGENLDSRWQTVIHPELADRLQQPHFPPSYRQFWQKFLLRPRHLAPQVHAAISEALADFSLHTVPQIIFHQRGRLIYAGGDDLCAVLPVSRALEAAWGIARQYRQSFLFQADDQSLPQAISESCWQPEPGRLLLHLGKGYTISGAILICHHKKPLAAAMRRAQELLKLAKNEGGRNALALELDRRGGAPRRFVCRWDETPWPPLGLPGDLGQRPLPEIFLELAQVLGDPKNQELSASLLYRLEELKTGLEALATEAPEQVVTFVAKQVWRIRRGDSQDPEEKEAKARYYAGLLAALTVRPPKEIENGYQNEDRRVHPEAPILARFIGLQRWRAGLGKEVPHG